MDSLGVPAISADGWNVSYGSITALSNVSFTLQQGGLCGPVGMNGAGKSTLFKALMGVIPVSSGQVAFCAKPSTVARREGLVSYVPQHDSVDSNFPLSVRDVVMMGRFGYMGWMRRHTQRDVEAVNTALERVELSDLATRPIGDLSGGQRKRVFVARGLAQHAKVMLLDEPFAGVHKKSEQTIVSLLRSLRADGVSILVASHDLHALPQLCDEVILLNRTVVMHDTVATALRPENLAVAFGLDRGTVGVM